ncbi:hypothetical protein BH11ACT2_BH11ACT2_06120 [soil metagenome]
MSTTSGTRSPYEQILLTGPLDPGVGGALITMVQVAPGFEQSYNEWYGGDHYYAGMMALPWCFSGSRWLATKRQRELRYPRDSNFADEITDGNFLNMYLGSPGRMDELSEGITEALERLIDEGRMHRDGARRQVFTAHQDYVGASYRDDGGPRDFHAFDHPYQACVLEVIDAPGEGARPALERWLLDEHLPAALRDGPAAMCLVFRTRPISGSSYVTTEMPTERFSQRVALVWMLDSTVEAAWEQRFAGEGDSVARAGFGTVEFVSGFTRLTAGTNDHLDELY